MYVAEWFKISLALPHIQHQLLIHDLWLNLTSPACEIIHRISVRILKLSRILRIILFVSEVSNKDN